MDDDALREKAEERINRTSPVIEAHEGLDSMRLIHELQVHQAELEMQKDELQLSRSELEKSQIRFRKLYQFAPIGYVTLSEMGVIIDHNRRFEALFPHFVSHAAGKPFVVYVCPEDHVRFFQHLRDVMAGPEERFCTLRLHSAERDFYARLSSIRMEERTDEGMRNLCLVTLTDVDAEETLIQCLQRAKEDAERASKAKSTFLANMSHEIRTPINGIVGMADMLQVLCKDTDQARYADMLKKSTMTLLRIVNDILDLSKIEAGKLAFVREPISVRQLVADACVRHEACAATKGLSLTCHVESDVPPFMEGDGIRIMQILENLISNAIKFTTEGGVHLNICRRSTTDGDRIDFQVIDTGIGIPADKLHLLFSPFEQIDNSLVKRYQGAGLGLSISRQLAEMMNGTLDVTSTEGKGSQFTLSLGSGTVNKV